MEIDKKVVATTEEITMEIDKKVVAITGGIGSGKSYIAKILERLNYKVIYSDKIAREILSSPQIIQELKKTFSEAIIGENNTEIDRKKLSEIVFSDKKKLDILNAVTHPAVISEIFSAVKNLDEKIIFVEIPLLFEGGYEKLFDKIIVVKRDKKARIESVIKRSGYSESEITKIINSQIDYETLNTQKYIVINNDDGVETLEPRVKEIINKL